MPTWIERRNMMNNELKRGAKLAALIAILFILAACASNQTIGKVATTGDGKMMLTMTADNFKFEPAVVKMSPGDILVLTITNISSIDHNFSIKDPNDEIMKNVDLPTKKTVTFEIHLAEAGTYEFFCDIPFHPTLGMKGRIEVIDS
jgi:plastocyanin